MENCKKSFISIFALLLFIIISCNSKTNNNKTTDNQILFEKKMKQNKKETHNVFENYSPVRRFDINRFNAESNGGKYNFIDAGMEVHQMDNAEYPSGKINGYYEYRQYPNSAYEFFSEDDAKGLLIQTLTEFYTFQFGTIKYYNSSGSVVEEENLDVPYKLSVDDLIDKMKTEYDIDITDSRICRRVERGVYEEHNNNPLYGVWLQPTCYVIDGITGKTLYTTTRYPFEKRGSLVNEYFKFLKENPNYEHIEKENNSQSRDEDDKDDEIEI